MNTLHFYTETVLCKVQSCGGIKFLSHYVEMFFAPFSVAMADRQSNQYFDISKNTCRSGKEFCEKISTTSTREQQGVNFIKS